MKKQTFKKPTLEKMNFIALLSLAIFSLINILRLYLKTLFNPELDFFYDFAFAFISLWTILSPFCIRFTNTKFSICWLVLSVVYVILSGIPLGYVNLLLFLLYHIVRYFFKKRYHYEFIPSQPGKGWFLPNYSEVEKRFSKEVDNKYMKVMILCGTIIIITCICLSGKAPIRH